MILWTDDDVLVDEQWLSAAAGAAERHPDALGFGGPIEPWFPVSPDSDYLTAFPSLRSGFCGLDHELPEGPLPAARVINGANMAFRRQVHLDFPFDTSLGMKPKQLGRGQSSIALGVGGWEEYDLITKLRARGGQIVWAPTMRVKHYVDPKRMSLPYILAYLKKYGAGSVCLEGIPLGRRVLGIPRWSIRKWLEMTTTYYYQRLKGNRAQALQQMGRRSELVGMMEQCFWTWFRGYGSGKAPNSSRTSTS